MLNVLNAYCLKGVDREITVAAVNMEGALEMAREQIGNKWRIDEIKHLGTIFVEQPNGG